MILRSASLSGIALAVTSLLLLSNSLAADRHASARTEVSGQFSLLLPEGWSIYDQSAALGAPGSTGVIIFSASPLNPPGSATADTEALVGVDRGDLPSFIVDRQRAERGMACAKLSKSAIYDIGTQLGRDPALSAMRRQFSYVTPRHEDIVLGGCKGVKFKLEASKGDAQNHVIIDVRAVSDGQVLYLFGLRNLAHNYAKNVGVFDAAMASLQFP